MGTRKLKILLVEDDKVDQMAFRRFVAESDLGYDYTIAGSVTEAKNVLASDKFDAVISDYRLGDGTAFDLLSLIVGAPVVVTTGAGDQDIAVKAMKSGAYDYLIKDRERNYLKVIPTTIEKALRRKELEDQLHIAQFSLDNSADLVLWATPDGKLTYANDEACQSLGYTRGKLLSLNLRDIVFDTSSKETKRVAKSLREKQSLRLEPWFSRKDSSTFPVEIQMNYEEFNEREYVFVFARDISKRKQADKALRESEEKLRVMFEAIGDGVGVTDLEATMVEVNEAFLHTFGLGDKKEAIGLTSFDLIAEKDHPKLLEHVGNILESGQSETREYTLLYNAGQEFQGETTAALMRDGSGNPVGFVSATRDITERKRTEQALRESEEKFRTIFENVNDEIIFVDENGVVIDVNERVEDIFGYKKEEVIGKNFAEVEFASPDVMMDMIQGFAETFNGDAKTRLVTYEARHRDGTPIFIEVSGNPIQLENGSMRSLAVLRDITERRRTEESLRDSEEGLNRAQQIAHVGSWEWNIVDGSYILSEEMRRIYGIDESMESAGFLDIIDALVHPDDREQMFLAAQEATVSGIGPTAVYRVIQPSGEIRWMEAVSPKAKRFTDDGSPLIMIGTVQDITERKLAEDELLRITKAVESSSDAIGMSDPNGCHFYQNEAFTTLFEYSAEELAAEGGGPAVYADQRVARGVFETIKAGKSWAGELEMVSKSGRKFPVALRANAVLDESSEIIGLVGIHTDITERKRAERELGEAHQRLMENAREAGMAEVATGMLHNVGNVVNSVGIITSSVHETVSNSRMANLTKVGNMLQEHKDDLATFLTIDERGQHMPAYISTLAQHLTDEQQKVIADMKVLSEHVKHIIEIVNLQQLYSKSGGLTEPVNPVAIMEDALHINASGLAKRDIEVIRKYEDLPVLPLDRHRIIQILNNLISNAKFALEQNRQARKTITVGVRNTNSHVRFEVADNGIGIAGEDMTRIFGHGFTTRKEGHGFGLHTGALAAKEMGGFLKAHSKGPGKGATFILEIPIIHEEQ